FVQSDDDDDSPWEPSAFNAFVDDDNFDDDWPMLAEPASFSACRPDQLQAHTLAASLPPGKSFNLIWDSGCSVSVTHDRNDFISFQPTGVLTKLHGIVKGAHIAGTGLVRWALPDVNGSVRFVNVPGYFVPDAKTRLLSTSSLLQTYPDERIELSGQAAILSGIPNDLSRASVRAPINPRNNLPMSQGFAVPMDFEQKEALSATVSPVAKSNHNLTEAEKELLRWHYRLGHLDFKKIKFLLGTGSLCRSESHRRLHTAASRLRHNPKCAACLLGKQTRRPAPGISKSVVRERSYAIRTDHLRPGQQVSVDHFDSRTKGRLFSGFGKTPDNEMYKGGAIFTDHATGYTHIELLTSLSSHATL
ncbi:MAG: GAG-pre-integrase domain-containing protein, partial [Marinobacter adhaerens]